MTRDVCEAERRTSKSSGLKRDGWATTAAWMIFSKARSNVRRAIEQKWTRHRAAQLQVGCLTAITVTGSAEYGYVLPLETFYELAHALASVFRGMFGYPQGIVKSSLN